MPTFSERAEFERPIEGDKPDGPDRNVSPLSGPIVPKLLEPEINTSR